MPARADPASSAAASSFRGGPPHMHLERFFVEGLAHSSYLLGSHRTGEAAVVGPLRDVELDLAGAERAGLRVRFLLETHVHDELLSGARALVANTGADHVASGESRHRF